MDSLWVDTMLQSVRKEYTYSSPKHNITDVTESDKNYIQSLVDMDNEFDTLQLKKKIMADVEEGNAIITKSSSMLGMIIIVHNEDYEPTFHIWWRIVRLLSKTPVRIVIFAHPLLRKMPNKDGPIEAKHINGGYAMRCDATSIIIYRQEEISRVMIHELLHASCSDPYHKSVEYIESDTEAWAEIILCAMAAKGNKNSYNRYMNEQILYSLQQAAVLRDKHKVHSDMDYAWRYTIGKFDVWKRLGLHIPDMPTKYTAIDSLRLTIHEPSI